MSHPTSAAASLGSSTASLASSASFLESSSASRSCASSMCRDAAPGAAALGVAFFCSFS